MSDYLVTLPDGTQLRVSMPATVRFGAGLSDADARGALLSALRSTAASAIAPHVRPRPARRDVVRDAVGRIAHVLDHPADPPAAETADALGAEVAQRFIDEVQW